MASASKALIYHKSNQEDQRMSSSRATQSKQGESKSTVEIEQDAVKAIKSSRYHWRTAEGIAKDLGKDLELVADVIKNSSKFIKSSRNSKSGKALYGVRHDYETHAPIAEKIASVLAGEIL